MKRKGWKNIFFGLCVVVIGGILFLKNYQDENFWNASFVQIVTLIVAGVLSFFFVQRLTDKRRKIDCYEHALTEIQTLVSDSEVVFSTAKEALLLQKSVANRIKHLKDHSFPQIKSDLEYIENQFEEMRDLYSNHNKTIGELKNIEPDMTRHKVNISDKIDKVKLELYDM